MLSSLGSMCRSTPWTSGRILQPSIIYTTAANALPLQQSGLSIQSINAKSSSSASAINFEDPQTVFSSKSTPSLFRSLCILKACRIKPLVHNAEEILDLARQTIGQKATNSLVEATFFKHFCAGTNAETIKPTLRYLMERGIQPVLNYAAEDDVQHTNGEAGDTAERMLEKAEADLAAKARIFMQSIHDCDNSTPARGFVGIKITGLCKPELLECMSQVLAGVGSPCDRGHSSSNLGQLLSAHLTSDEQAAYQKLWQRLTSLAAAAYNKGNMRLMIDAEHSYMQPAIDALTIALQQRFNKDEAVIMNTYQCYLKCSATRIERDLKRAFDEKWVWGAKTVRGAYMHHERALAQEHGYVSPILETLQDTHINYNSCMENVMKHVAKRKAELMIASHNQKSVEMAVQAMADYGISQNQPGSGMYFGQLLGMADNLSFPLGAQGYNIYKICAYGSVSETIAYLLRRALENSDVLGGASKETELIRAELLRRMNPFRKATKQEPQTSHLQHV